MIIINFQNKENLPANLLYFMVYEYLQKLDLGKIDKKEQDPDFGNYKKAAVLGWGFKNANTYKKYLHLIFKDNYFYPKSLIVKKDWVNNNKTTVEKFMNNERFVVKPDKGQSGKGVHLVNSVSDIVGRIDNNFWILQKVVEPKLYNGKKFDIRIFHFILRYKNSYYNIMTKSGIVKTCVKKYTNSMDGFLTNIMHNNKLDKSTPHIFNFFDFMEKLEPQEEKRKEHIVKIYNVIRDYSLLLSKKLNEDPGSKSDAQIIMYGPDIMMDNEDNFYLLETNSSPGILIKSEISYKNQKEMLNELMGNVITPILQKKKINLSEYKGKLLFIEKLI